MREGDGFGTSKGDFTSLSVRGIVVSSRGSDNGPPTDRQDGGGPLPLSSDYDLNADYSSSTVDGLFPAWVTGSGSADFNSWMNDQTLFGDSDNFGGFFINAFGSSSLGLSIFHPLEDRPGKRGSYCSSDGSTTAVIRCDNDMMTNLSVGSDDADPSGLQSPYLPDLNAPFGRAHSSAMTWQWGVIQGAFPPDATPPVVDSPFDPASLAATPTSEPLSDSPSGGPLANIGGGPLANIGGGPLANIGGSVPEIPAPAMLLMGFAGLALVGSRRRWRSARLG